MDAIIGFTSTTSVVATSFVAGFLASGGFSFECFETVQPFMLRNSVKSVHFLLQHDHPLYASWKKGNPGWYLQASTKYTKFKIGCKQKKC